MKVPGGFFLFERSRSGEEEGPLSCPVEANQRASRFQKKWQAIENDLRPRFKSIPALE